MKNHIRLCVTIIGVCSSSGNAQNTKVNATSETRTKYVEINIIKTYEKIAGKGYKSIEIFQKLGNSYYSNSELDKAARWYCELFAMTTDLEPEYYYRYIKSLKSIGDNDEANKILEKFNQKLELTKERTFKKQL